MEGVSGKQIAKTKRMQAQAKVRLWDKIIDNNEEAEREWKLKKYNGKK
jgi:hypothetical protein